MLLYSHRRPPFHISKGTHSIYIMGDTTVPWFGPISLIGCQGTQKVTSGTTTWHNDGDGQHDNGDGWHDNGDGRQGDEWHDNGDGRHNNGRHDDGKGQQGNMRHDDGNG